MSPNQSTLVILPGWGGNELLWQHQCQHLQDLVKTQVIVISDKTTPQDMLQEIVKELPEKITLLGHSMGGWFAQRIAIDFPERVEKLILVSTSTGGVNPDLKKLIWEMSQKIKQGQAQELLEELRPNNIHPSRHRDKMLLQEIAISQNKFPEVGLLNQNQICIDFKDMTHESKKIKCPTLIIYGRQDSFFTLQEQKTMQEHISNAKLVIIEDTGHLPSVERPQAITALIRLWLQI